MADRDRVARLLQRLRDDLGRLQLRAAYGRERILADEDVLGNSKYLFVTAIEGCIDIAQHFCSSEEWGPPEHNAHAIALLAEHGVIERALAERLAEAVGFRNVLVHGYAHVDDERVVKAFADLPDLIAFSEAIATRL